LCFILKITFSELNNQPSWWVDDMLDIVTTKNSVEADDAKKQQKKAGSSTHRGRRR